MIGKLLLFACLVLVADSAVHKLKVNTLPGKVSRLLKEGRLEEFKTQHKKAVDFHLQKRLHRPSTRASRLGKSQTVDEYSYYTYTVNVTIGTPPQPFQLLLNTYDDSIWVPDISCSDDACGCNDDSDPCYIKNKFDRRESTTFKTGKLFETNYSNKYCLDNKSFSDYSMGGTGIFANDTIGLVPSLQVQNATFGLEDNPASYLSMFPFDGYLSLSYKIEDGKQKPIVEQAFDQKLIDAPIFTFFLKGDGFKINDQPGGQITFGGVDTENCSPDVGYVPVYNQEDWVFDVLKTEISRKTKGGTWTGAVGSEITTIVVPQQSFNDISSTTNAAFDSTNGYYSVDCGVKFEWTVTLANQNKLTITEKKGVTQIDDTCYLLFEPLPEGDSELFFGGAFIHSYCQVFDMTGQIGFSKVLDN